MAHFRGTIQGQRGEASRLGSKSSGLVVQAQSWEGKVIVSLEHHQDGYDLAHIHLAPHHGRGVSRVLWVGRVGGE